jgi:hypothetical protein
MVAAQGDAGTAPRVQLERGRLDTKRAGGGVRVVAWLLPRGGQVPDI